MLASTAAAVLLDHPAWPIYVGILSLLSLLLRSRGAWTPDGSFGLANAVTCVRLLLTAALVVDAPRLHGHAVAAVTGAIFALDVADGWLARRQGTQGPFGALFDMEVDAVFVLALAIALWSRGVGGAWILLAGLWRYLFVVVPMVAPSRGGEAPRSIYYRSAYAVMVVCFLSAWFVPPALGRGLCVLGTGVLSVSFLRSFWYRYVPRAEAA